MIARMTRYDFILLSGETEAFLTALQNLGVVDIERSAKALDAESARMMSEAEALKKRIELLEKEDFSKDSGYAAILDEMALWKKTEAERVPWGEFDPSSLERLAASGAGIRFYCVSRKKFDASWAEQAALEIISDDGSRVWFVTVGDHGLPIQECAAPEGPASAAAAKLESLRDALAVREAELRAEKDRLPSMRSELSERIARVDQYFAGAAGKDAAENLLTVFTGFAPSENDEVLKAEFDKMDMFWTSGKAVVDDNPPIKLRNNRFVGMFEVLTDMYGRPKYDGFDPTVFISVFFLLFFAMCMGDAGYGLVLVVIGLLLKKAKGFAGLAPLVVTLGIGTFVVGFFFHTFFSIDIAQWDCVRAAGLDKVMLPSKIAGYDGTMVVALAVGVIHLCLAMIVKTVQATKNRGFLGSLSIWGWTLLIVGGVALAAVAVAFHLDSTLVKWLVIGLGGLSAIGIFFLNDLHRNPLLNVGAGLWETYNTATGILGDVLSYLRLYALGLAGSMLGFAFNDLAKMALGDGGFGWIPFIAIALVGHTLNVAMAALGAFVHPLRLNFLEFFKNSDYDGSGRAYNPLKK